MQIINENKLEEARKKIDKAFKNEEKILVVAKDDNFNRKILENKKVDFLSGVELGERRDKIKQRDSGLNQVFCKLAKENNIIICIDFKEFEGNDFIKSKFLSRVIQNISLCKKYDVKMVITNYRRNKKDLNAFLLGLGMSTSMAKYAVENSFNF